MSRAVTLIGALILFLSPLTPAAGSASVPAAPTAEWTIPEAAANYRSIVGPFNQSRAALNQMTVGKANARTYCGGVVRSLDKLNLGLSRGLWPGAIRAEVKGLLRASVLLRSKHRQCQTARTGAGSLNVIKRNSRSNQRLWDAVATEAGLIRLGLGLPPS